MNINKLDALIFDFDGVLTDNKVYVDQDGKESVCCNRSDGLAFDALRKLGTPVCILSTESNPVVTSRANKLKVKVIQGANNKLESLNLFCIENNYNIDRLMFVGNDLNDFQVMQACGYSACPNDSHPSIKEISNYVLSVKGGDGIVRELLEDILSINLLKILY
jgi:YrbI family 3-deoxy-D-manno-octulosonate 8-phosphate phosphatase